MSEIAVLKRSPVYKKELLSPAFLCQFRIRCEAMNFHIASFFLKFD